MKSFVFNANYAAATPVYRQLAIVLEKAIDNGQFGHRSPLPPINDLSKASSIARREAVKAYGYLSEQGKVFYVEGEGFYGVQPASACKAH